MGGHPMGGLSPVDTIEVSTPPTRTDVARALARALDDPTLRVWFGRASGDVVEPSGHEPGGTHRGLVDVTLEGELVGVISYDVTRVTDRARVEAAAKLVALEADHARVTAQLAAGQAAAREPLARLVECNETERRRIARDLHDGLQNRLVLMGLGAQQIERDPTASDSVVEAVGQLRAELSASVAELRRLAAGVMPVTLVERGLFTAAEHFVSSLPIRTSLTLSGTSDDLPSAVESAAYFVVTEAATNVLKHSRADSVSIALERTLRRLRVVIVDNGVGGAHQRGTGGLTGLADRLTALGGRLEIDSPPSKGTRVWAEIPCGSRSRVFRSRRDKRGG